MTAIYEVDPISDPRWLALLERHASASIFHTPGWLKALRLTYGYEPVVLTSCPPGAELTNGLAFCRINSWLTGRRTVSLPFSDHCEPFVAGDKDSLHELLHALVRDVQKKRFRYTEIRPLSEAVSTLNGCAIFRAAKTYCCHELDLHPSLDELFGNFHKNCVQRKILRAEREGLTYQEGRTESLMATFYELLSLTRSRQRLPPHPRSWFRNLLDCLGDRINIRVASRDDCPIASILTLSYKSVLVYKYGCSDARFKNLGATHFLFWKAIQDAKVRGLQVFDLGRSACDNHGLICFKDRWGAARRTVTYWRYPARFAQTAGEGWDLQMAKKIFSHMPDSFLTVTGRLLYRHIG